MLPSRCKQRSFCTTRPSPISYPKVRHRPLPLPRRRFGVNAVRYSPRCLLSDPPCLLPNSSLELSKELPPHRYHFVRPLPKPNRLAPFQSLRPVDTIEPIRSVPAVSHDLDVLLRTELRRSIAPCNQSGVQPVADLTSVLRQTNRNQPTGTFRIEPKFSSSSTCATRFLMSIRR